MVPVDDFISGFSALFPGLKGEAWEITSQMEELVYARLAALHSDCDYTIRDGVAVHKSAHVEAGVVLKAPVMIGAGCFVGAHAYFRSGVYLAEDVKIGPGCEIKSSLIMKGSATAHFNYVGNSLIGSYVNMEAGSVIANHYNERSDRTISVLYNSEIVITGVKKFGALVGDHSKIGANAVLSPGTLLKPGSIVKRLELVEQVRP